MEKLHRFDNGTECLSVVMRSAVFRNGSQPDRRKATNRSRVSHFFQIKQLSEMTSTVARSLLQKRYQSLQKQDLVGCTFLLFE